jgi:hypothetical protein
MIRLLIAAGVAVFVALMTARPAAASEGFEDLVKVAKSGADDKAVAAYIDASPVAYALTADEIQFLDDLGLSDELIKAVTEHGKKLAGGVVESPQPPPEAVPPPPPPESVSPPEAEAPTPAPEEPQSVAKEPQSAGEEPPPAVSLPPPEAAAQETVVDAPVVEAPAPEAVDVSSFYDALSPYGTWFNVDGAWYWQPTAMVVDSSWSPYCQGGHWVYTDWGWMWQSDYSWGWAPFHYGRWSRHARYGWIWLPDTVWGPAWVSWRHSDAAIGWAPLPPAARFEAGIGFTFHGLHVGADFEFGLGSGQFTFVPVARFGERELVRSRLPRTEVTRVYHTTTVIQNNYSFSANRIINRGPSAAHLQQVTHREFKPIRIVDQNLQAGQAIRPGRTSGDSVAVYRPHVVSTARETPQTVVARRQATAQVKREEARKAPVLEVYKSAPLVQAERAHGQASLGTVQARNTPPIPSRPPVPREINDTVARQRQAEEAAARQRQEQQRRADTFARQQEARRKAEAFVQDKENQRQRAEALARQQDEQRRQVAELARQQEQRRNAAETARRQDEQRRAWQAQRQAEEAAARQQVAQRNQLQRQQPQAQPQRQQPQVAQQRTQQSAFQGNGNRSMANAASTRGSVSRGGTAEQRDR